MLNKVMVIGNVGSDPEIRKTSTGASIASFSVAAVERWKGQDGQKQERVEWIRVAAFGATANIVESYVKKGARLYVEGSLSTRKYQDKSGAEKTITEVKCRELKMLSQSDQGGYQKSGPVNGNLLDQQPMNKHQTNHISEFDDDIPF